MCIRDRGSIEQLSEIEYKELTGYEYLDTSIPKVRLLFSATELADSILSLIHILHHLIPCILYSYNTMSISILHQQN